jgi:hypothetical protein
VVVIAVLGIAGWEAVGRHRSSKTVVPDPTSATAPT